MNTDDTQSRACALERSVAKLSLHLMRDAENLPADYGRNTPMIVQDSARSGCSF